MGKGARRRRHRTTCCSGLRGPALRPRLHCTGKRRRKRAPTSRPRCRHSAGSIDAAPGPESGQAEVASGDEPKGTPAPQSQDAAPTKAEPDATETAAPPPPGAEGGTDRPIAGRSRRRRRASALETSDADTQAAAKKRARAKRSDRGVGAGTVGEAWATQTKAADADAVAPTKRRLRATEGLGNEAAAETGAAPTRRSREKPSVLDGARSEESQAAASVGGAGSAGRPPAQHGHREPDGAGTAGGRGDRRSRRAGCRRRGAARRGRACCCCGRPSGGEIRRSLDQDSHGGAYRIRVPLHGGGHDKPEGAVPDQDAAGAGRIPGAPGPGGRRGLAAPRCEDERNLRCVAQAAGPEPEVDPAHCSCPV